MDKYLSVRSVSRAVSFSPLTYIYFSFTSLPRHLPILCWSPIPGPCGLIGLHGFECELIKEGFSTGETNQMHFRVNLPSWTVLYPVLRPGARARSLPPSASASVCGSEVPGGMVGSIVAPTTMQMRSRLRLVTPRPFF